MYVDFCFYRIGCIQIFVLFALIFPKNCFLKTNQCKRMLLSQMSVTEQQKIENTVLVVLCVVFWIAILLFAVAACMAFRFWSIIKAKTVRIGQLEQLALNLHCEAAGQVQQQVQDEASDQQDHGYASLHDLELI